jgi:hypothetical protein
VEVGVDRQAQVRDVVVDPDREVPLWPVGRKLLEDRLDHRRRHLLRGEAVAAADDPGCNREGRRVGVHALGDRRNDL